METSLHRQLKEQYRLRDSQIEVKVGRYRIDVVNEGRLVEIQQSGLSAIRDKIQKLLKDDYVVEVVKPLIARKRIIKLSQKHGSETHRRWSPKRGTELSLFDELIYFTRVFPHPNLKLIVPLVEIEEIRYPGHGRKRRWRQNDFVIQDRMLLKTKSTQSYERATDLHRLLPAKLESPFDTKQLAHSLGIHRYDAQRIAYVLRKTGSAVQVGKKGNAVLYELATPAPKTQPQKRRLVDLQPDAPAAKPKSKKKSAKPKKTTIRPGKTKSRKKRKSVAASSR